MCAVHYGRFKTKVRRHDRLFAGSAGCSEILKARAPRVLPGAPSGIGLRKSLADDAHDVLIKINKTRGKVHRKYDTTHTAHGTGMFTVAS